MSRFISFTPCITILTTAALALVSHVSSSPPTPAASRPASSPAAADITYPWLPPRPTLAYDTWNTFGYNLTAHNVSTVARALTQNGMKAAGYDTIILGGGWACSRHNVTRELLPCPQSFPRGIPWTVRDLQRRGFKVGLVFDRHNETHSPFVDPTQNWKRDVLFFAKWGVDLVQVDLFADPNQPNTTTHPSFQAFRQQLDKVAPHIQLRITNCPNSLRELIASPQLNETNQHQLQTACRIGPGLVPFWDYFTKMDTLFPDPAQTHPTDPQGEQNRSLSNGVNALWTRSSILEIIDLNANFYFDRPNPAVTNDMGPLIVGLGGQPLRLQDTRSIPASSLTVYQQLSQFALWCFLKSPIIAINDLANMTTISHRILTHKGLLAIQDRAISSLAKKVVSRPPLYDIFATVVCPGNESLLRCGLGIKPDVAVLVLNRRTDSSAGNLGPVRIPFADIGLCRSGCSVTAENVLDSTVISGFGTGLLTDTIPYGGVAVFRLSSTGSAQVPRVLNAMRDILSMGVYWSDAPPKGHLSHALKDLLVMLCITSFVVLLGSTAFIPPRKIDA